MKKSEEFNLYSYYKKRWLTPLIICSLLILSLFLAILFKFVFFVDFGYDIAMSVFTGTVLFIVTQLVLYINKSAKIKIQEDKSKLFSVNYKLSNLIKRYDDIKLKIENEETYVEFRKIIKETYILLYRNKKVLERCSIILSKKYESVFWANLYFIYKNIYSFDFNYFINNPNYEIKFFEKSFKLSEIESYYENNIYNIKEQIDEIYNDFSLFYKNEINKISKDIF